MQTFWKVLGIVFASILVAGLVAAAVFGPIGYAVAPSKEEVSTEVAKAKSEVVESGAKALEEATAGIGKRLDAVEGRVGALETDLTKNGARDKDTRKAVRTLAKGHKALADDVGCLTQEVRQATAGQAQRDAGQDRAIAVEAKVRAEADEKEAKVRAEADKNLGYRIRKANPPAPVASKEEPPTVVNNYVLGAAIVERPLLGGTELGVRYAEEGESAGIYYRGMRLGDLPTLASDGDEETDE